MAERVKLGFVGEISWKLVGLIVDCNFYKSCMHFSCHMHMHTCSSNGGGGHIRGGCGATGAPGASPAAGGSWGSRPKAPLTPVLSSRRKASPGAHPFIPNYDTYNYVSITCALGLGIVCNPSCMIPRFPRVTSM